MKKIPTIFKRNPENMSEILNEPHPDCGWVFAGEGVATRKYDGICVLIQDGKYYKRREVKEHKPIPPDFVEADYDEITGKRVGWVPVTKEDKWHLDAFVKYIKMAPLKDGTKELCGPKIQGNPEKCETHILISHNMAEQYKDAPRTFDGLKDWLKGKDIEGLVFQHHDGRMAKIKGKNFGLKRKREKTSNEVLR